MDVLYVNMCMSYVQLNDKNEIFERSSEHNHTKVSVELLNRSKQINNLKHKAIDDPYDEPSKPIH